MEIYSFEATSCVICCRPHHPFSKQAFLVWAEQPHPLEQKCKHSCDDHGNAVFCVKHFWCPTISHAQENKMSSFTATFPPLGSLFSVEAWSETTRWPSASLPLLDAMEEFFEYDAEEFLVFLTLLITEGRTPEYSVKGRTEGLHCPPAQSAMPPLHKHECSDKLPQVVAHVNTHLCTQSLLVVVSVNTSQSLLILLGVVAASFKSWAWSKAKQNADLILNNAIRWETELSWNKLVLDIYLHTYILAVTYTHTHSTHSVIVNNIAVGVAGLSSTSLQSKGFSNYQLYTDLPLPNSLTHCLAVWPTGTNYRAVALF